MKININFFKSLFLFLISFLVVSCETDKDNTQKKDIKTVLRKNNVIPKPRKPFFYITDNECQYYLTDPLLKRLKDIDQSGPAHLFSYTIPPYTRLSHSIGVYNLLKRNHASKAERIAGLYHDVTHTVFSHTSDYLENDYQKYVEESMHDSMFDMLLDNPETKKILEQENLSIKDINPSNPDFKMLEAPLPEMNADRIEYTIHTAYLLGLITIHQVHALYDDLFFNKELGLWFFMNDYCAFIFGYCSLILNLKFWAAPWCFQQNMHLAKAIKLAIKLNVFTKEDLFKMTDQEIMVKLKSCENIEIKKFLQYTKIFTLDERQCPQTDYELVYFKPKFRGIDPRVGTNCKKYSEVGKYKTIFNLLFFEVKQYCAKGYWVPIARSSIDNVS